MRKAPEISPRKQSGIVLLGIVIILVLGALTYFVSSLSVVEVKQRGLESTSRSLQQAKDALIAFAAARASTVTPSIQAGRTGYLPCPGNNVASEGSSVGICGAVNEAAIGWFPWRSLGLPPLRDESGTCLFYAVSGSYKFNPPTTMLNEDTYGMFQVVDDTRPVPTTVIGANPEDRVVAIVFAAGKLLPGQVRNIVAGTPCGNDNLNDAAYLDSFIPIDNSAVAVGAADQIDQFMHATATSDSETSANPHNDRFITITRDELWQAIMMRTDQNGVDNVREEYDATIINGNSKTRRVTEALARCMAQYGNDNDSSRLPYPAPVDFAGNDYRNNFNYTDGVAVAAGQHFGRFPYIVNDADVAISGSIVPAVLFDKPFAAPPNHAFPDDIRQCNNLPVLDPAGVNADLRTITSEDRIFWENRKDHFFYAVSNAYWPDAAAANDVLPDPTAAPARCGNCITVNGVSYAAVVIYAGVKQGAQTRDAPIAATDVLDTKMFATNYIEVVNAAGNGMGDYSQLVGGNDVMFCITDTEPLGVVECP